MDYRRRVDSPTELGRLIDELAEEVRAAIRRWREAKGKPA